jgi:hypothetical protein
MREDIVPDVSLGTHFFNELVEMDILYMALFPTREGNFIGRAFFEEQPNRLTDLLPEEGRWAETVRVIDAADLPDRAIVLNANTLAQTVLVYLDRDAARPAPED